MQQPVLASRSTPEPHGLIDDLKAMTVVAVRGWRVVAAAALVGLTAGVIYLARVTILYRAECRLLILQNSRIPLAVAQGDAARPADSGEDDLATQALLIRSPLVVGRALDSLASKGRSVRDTITGLSVSRPEPTAKILQVNYLARDRAEATRLLGAITESYQKFLEDRYQKSNQTVVVLIKKARDELGLDLQELEKKYLQLRMESRGESADEEGALLLSRRIEHWDRTSSEVMTRAIRLKAQLALGRKLAAEGAGFRSIVFGMNQLGGDVSSGTPPREGDDGHTTSTDRTRVEVADVEVQRAAAEHVFEQLQADGAAPRSAPGGDDDRRSFLSETEPARLARDIRETREKLLTARRLTRNALDPSVARLESRAAALQAQLDRLWQERLPATADGRGPFEGAELREAEMKLLGLRSLEKSLRAKLGRLDASRLRLLKDRERRLTESHGRDDRTVGEVRDQIATLSKSTPDPDVPADRADVHEFLGAVERSLEMVEAMRAEIRQQYEKDREESRANEIQRLATSSVKNNLERQRALFNTVVDQLKQAQLAGDFNGITSQVIDPPNAYPVRKQPAIILSLALAAGIALGVGVVVISEQADQRIGSPDEARNLLGYATLGVVPRVPAGFPAEGAGMICHLLPRSPTAEAYRMIRTNLELLGRKQRAQVVMVVSPQSGDGKSTTASNLAIISAHTGRRVLLIDADLRRPSVGKIHGISKGDGIGQILDDEPVPFDDVVRPSAVKGLDLITAGLGLTNPADLLTSPQFGRLLETVRGCYDVVLIDSAPLLSVADASILAGHVDGMVLVLKPPSLRRSVVERTRDVLNALGTPVLGVLYNGAETSRFNYGYGYGYGGDQSATSPGLGSRLFGTKRKPRVAAPAQDTPAVG